jgi:hypothetical protein
MSFACDLCNATFKKSYFKNISSICPICDNEIKRREEIKHELQENKAKAFIPNNYKIDLADLRHNKYCYRQALIRIQCSIPERLIKISHWQLSQEINKIKLELKLSSKDKLYSDLINIIIGYTAQQFEYDVKMKNENSFPIHYLID